MQFIKISGGFEAYRQAVVDDLMKSVTNSYIKFENVTLEQVKHAINHYGGTTTCVFTNPEHGVEGFLNETAVSASVIVVMP